jgi:Leucine-rich repeat (LRR) protein
MNNEIITSIPRSIGNLTRLEALDLSSSQIPGSIPPSIGNLTRLESLGHSQWGFIDIK